MDPNNVSDKTPEQLDRKAYTGGRAKLVKAGFALALVVLGVLAMNYLIHSSPRAKRRVPTPSAPLVRVQTIFPETRTVTVEALGTVVPDREMTLKARVSGEIEETHPDFVEGGFLRKDDTVVRLDDADYRLARTRAESAVVDSRYALELEQGRQDVARREWALFQDGASRPPEDSALALRKPHLEKTLADLAAAEADLRQAQLQVERTRIAAPFDAVIRTRYVTIGSQVTAQEKLADLVATDQYRIRVSVATDQLAWIAIPRRPGQAGAPARVLYRGGAVVRGRVVKLLSDLETEGRMARILVAVDDPLALKRPVPDRPPMLLGEFVRVEITGRTIPEAYRIARSAFRDDAAVWIATPDNTLDIRPVRTVWRDKTTVLVTRGLSPGERLIVSNLAAPAGGMAVTVEGEGKAAGAVPAEDSGGKRP